ncbi:MAG: hypothetical protein EBS32_08140, partial [Actinobacteria bacterium]|nr:hypothetical protein [Actinomycetota bacterium]
MTNKSSRTVAVECHHLADRTVEERPVVTDDHDDAGPFIEVVLERPQGVEVEVVRRFVEKEDVRLLHEREQQL